MFALVCLVAIFPRIVMAATYGLPADIGSGPFSSCSGGGPVYNCSGDVTVGNNDSVTLSSDVTLVINGDFDVGKDTTIDDGGFSFSVDASGDINLDDRSQVSASLAAGGKIDLGKNTIFSGSIVAGDDISIGDDADVTADIDSGAKIDVGKRAVISGNITATDDIGIGDDAVVTGNIDSGAKIDVGKRAVITGDLGAGDDINIDQNVVVNGNVTTTGNLDIDDTSIVNGTCNPAHPRCTGGGGPPGSSCETFFDQFTTSAYTNQDGTLAWQTDWNEVVDDGTPGGGNIFINANALRFRGGAPPATVLGSRYIEREADLSAFTSATLTFDYKQNGNWEPDDLFEIYASGDGGATWSLVQSFADDLPGGNQYQLLTLDLTAFIAADTRIAFVIKADNAAESFFVDNVLVEGCASAVTLDHFRITPATTGASTCLPNAITIVAEDASNNTLTTYTGSVDISTSTAHGNWSVNSANNTTSPNPDSDDNGAVGYSFLLSDAGVIILDLTNTHAETLTITVTDPAASVATTSVPITYSSNVFVITEDPVQVAGRPLAMNIAMWTDDLAGSATCGIDTNYNYPSISLDASIDRGGVLPGANDPVIAAVTIPDGPASAAVTFDFSLTPGQASFNLGSSDVGQYRLIIEDNTGTHGSGVIAGTSAQLTLRPFGIAVTGIEETATSNPNPGNATTGLPIFTAAGNDLGATVAGVLWDAADDTEGGVGDGVIDAGRLYNDNAVATSYAWDTDLLVAAAGFTPATGTPGAIANGLVTQAEFAGGSATINDWQYDEVGSFTLQSRASNYLGVAGLDVSGDDIVVGRFTPASFRITNKSGGSFQDTCNNTFTYIGEAFGYNTAPTFDVTALNAQNLATGNYRDGYAKLDGGSITVNVTQDAGNLLVVSYIQAAMIAVAANDNSGNVGYSFGGDSYRYGPAAPVTFARFPNSQVAPFTANIDPEITQVSDGEVTTLLSETLDPTATASGMRFGRLRMENVHGSELDALEMPAFTEYWTGAGWTKSIDDSCTSIADANLVSSGSPPGLSVPSVRFTPFASAGDVILDYPSPGSGNDGFVDTTVDLGSAAQLWLRYDWDADGIFDNDPFARATFGIFEGDDVQIYIRQIYE